MRAARRLRIALVADLFEGKSGGVVSAARFAAALRRGHEVKLVGAGAAADVRMPAFLLPGVRRVMREMGFTFAVPRRRPLEEALAGADVVHAWFPFWLGMRAAAAARRLGVPLVASFHVQPENLLRNVGLESPARVERVYRLFRARFFDLADAVVCPSAFARDELQRRGVTRRIEVISNGVEPERTPSPRPPGDGRFLLLAVGRLAREKRLDVVLEGVRRSRHAPRIRLVITGRGPEEERVRRLAAALPVPAEVGFVPDEELRRLLRRADLLLHASEVELEGMAVLEALGCGLPALVADAPASAARELAVSPELLFESGNPADLARRLDALLDAPERLEDARRRCPELARARAFPRSVARLEALYRELVSARAAASLDALRAAARSTPAGR